MGRRQRASRTPSPPPVVETEELDLEAFSASLLSSGLTIRDVSNDGNCFFRAVSDQLYGTEDYHMKLRERACDYLLAHKNHYCFFVDDEKSFDDYVAEMRTDGIWADNLELQAISMTCMVNIRIHQSGKPSYDIRNHPEKSAQAIHLSYHFAEHYASVRPLHTANQIVPAQHPPLPPPRTFSPSSGHNSDTSPHQKKPLLPNHQDPRLAAVWSRAERGHSDMCSLVDRTKRAARAVRIGEDPESIGSCFDAARSVERQMREAQLSLREVGKLIDDGKSANRFKSKKIVSGYRNRVVDDNGSGSDAVSSYSEDDSEEDEQHKKAIQRETENIFALLDDIENAVRAATEKVAALTLEKGSSSHDSSKSGRASKKKEQEARRRGRKERRRREQERDARADIDDVTPPPGIAAHALDIAI